MKEENVLGFPFISFLAPGLIAMSIIQQSFSHSSSSLMIGKIQGNIIDTLMAPLSPARSNISDNICCNYKKYYNYCNFNYSIFINN